MNTNTNLLPLGSVSTKTQSGGFEVDDAGIGLKKQTPAAV